MKRTLLFSILAMLSVHAHSQQTGEIDLGRHQFDKSAVRDPNVVPEGCGVPRVVHGDGVIVDPDPKKKSKLKVELTLPKDTFQRGETVEGSIVLQNVGTGPIIIPWSPDPSVRVRPKDASQHAYDVGWFDLKLRGAGKVKVSLETDSESDSLYSSASIPGSSLSINPGEWVTIKLRFLIDQKHILSARLPIRDGYANIEIEWRQARFEWHANGCAIETGYFTYGYQENAKPIRIKIAE